MENNEKFQDFEKEGRLKKTAIGILGILLLLLLLSYFLLSYPIFPILESLFESKEAKNNKIFLEEFTINFLGGTYNDLQHNYHINQSVEFVSCLEGKKEGREYFIEETYIPEVSDQSFNHISFKPCSEDTIILLHSHPYRRCIASGQDLLTLDNLKVLNPERMMVIMCESDRFSVYN
jgi:hypothetical protein